MTHPQPMRWNLQADPAARASLAARCESLRTSLADLPPESLRALVIDTRPLHCALFCAEASAVAGVYRGTPGTPLAQAARAVFLARRHPGLRMRDLCTAPEDVAAAMALLGARLGTIWDSAPHGDAAFDALAEVTHGFLSVHPYLDGNGHVFRLIATLLGSRIGLLPRPEFTLHPRPYDHLMSLCLQWYPDHPGLLSAYLRRWFTG